VELTQPPVVEELALASVSKPLNPGLGLARPSPSLSLRGFVASLSPEQARV